MAFWPKIDKNWHRIYLKFTQKDFLWVELFRFLGIFDIVSSDLCLILSNLKAVQSVSQSVDKNLPNAQKEGGGGSKAFWTMLKKLQEW